jgi:hypothetical protein
MSQRSVIPPGRRTVRAAGPTRPRAAADRARIFMSALTPGLEDRAPATAGPTRPQPPAAGRHPPSGKGKARGGERREGIPQVGGTSAAESMVARKGAKPQPGASGDRRAATRAHRRDHPPRDACDRQPADQQPARPWHPASGHSRTARLPLPWQPVPLEKRIWPVTCGSSVRHAARVYSLIRPPRTGFRRICCASMSVTVARGASGSPWGTC